jgi:putative transposase
MVHVKNISLVGAVHEPPLRHRRSIRLRGYDYSRAGAYFVTICTKNRECLFGDVADGEMRMNDDGRMVQSAWEALPERYPGVGIDAWIVMPNHVHGIIILTPVVGAGPRARPKPCARPTPRAVTGQPQGVGGQPQGVAPTYSLPDVVHRLKSLTTTHYRQGVLKMGWRPFAGTVWQRNYYERVIRDADEMNRIREYIATNPAHWAEDENNPSRVKKISPVGAGPCARPKTRAHPDAGQPQGVAPTDSVCHE